MTDKNDLKNTLVEAKKTNEETRDFINNVDKKIAELDIRFAKTIIKDDINTLRTAKKILHEKKSNHLL